MKRLIVTLLAAMLACGLQAQTQQGYFQEYAIPSRSAVFTMPLGVNQVVLQTDSMIRIRLTHLVKPGWKLDTVYKSGWYKAAASSQASALWLNVKDYGATGNGTTDDYNAINTVLGMLQHTGGTVYFPRGTYKITGKLRIMRSYTFGTTPVQLPIRLTGEGGGIAAGSDGITILDLYYNGSDAKFFTNGRGLLEIDHLTMRDAVGGSLPMLATTNTTLHLHDMMFMGARYIGCSNGVVLGGTNPTPVVVDSTINSAFQGYGTVIENCQFAYMKTGIKLQTAASGVVIKNNNFMGGCDTNDPYIDINSPTHDPDDDENIHGGTISDNMFTLMDRKYGIRFYNGYHFSLSGNTFYDTDAGTVASLYFTYNSGLNRILESLTLGAVIDSSPPYNSNTYLGDITRLRHLEFHGDATTSTGSYIATGNANGFALAPKVAYVVTHGMISSGINTIFPLPSGGKIGVNTTNVTSTVTVNGDISATGGNSAEWNAKEPGLGVPSTNGFVLSSTTAGVRSWIANESGGSMVFPGEGIAVSTGSGWGTSITNNSTAWNTVTNKINKADSTGNAAGNYVTHKQLGEKADTLDATLRGTTNVFNVKYQGASSENTWSGDVIILKSKSNLAGGDVCFIDSDGEAVACNASSISGCPHALFVASQDCSEFEYIPFYIRGTMNKDVWDWTPGAVLYVSSSTSGGLTQTAPTGEGDVVIPVAVALSTNTIYFTGNINTLERN